MKIGILTLLKLWQVIRSLGVLYKTPREQNFVGGA